jgi:ABC-type multidrug transport system fused ATPase/permease subunit
MRKFWRAMAFVWPYRGRLALSLACGLVVAVFWGANISAVYPLLTVLLEKKSLVDWADEKIAHETQKVVDLESNMADIRRAGERARRVSELESRRWWLERYQRVRPYLERYTPRDSFRTLCLLMLVLLVGMIIKGFFDYLHACFAGLVVQRSMFDLRNRFFRKTLHLDLAHFTEQGTHYLMSRFTNDLESLTSGMRALLGKVLLEPMKAASCLLCACLLNWRLTLIALLFFPAVVFIMAVIGRYLKRMSRRNLESMTRIYKILQESFVGIRVVKAFSMERYERRRFFRETKKYYNQAMKLIRTEALGEPLLEVFAVSAVVGALLAGSYLVITGETHVWGIRLTFDPLGHGKLLTMYALILGVCDPLRKVFAVFGRVQRGVAASERIFQAMDRKPKVTAKPRATHLARHSKSIELHNVAFGYHHERAVLRNINLAVQFGETIAVVGPTGSGKTSLVNLLPRFYDPLAGQVLIDGVDIREISLSSLRKQMGIVTQHTILFDDTIFNNIAYGKPDIDHRKVEAAAKAAYAHQFIANLPGGYDAVIGEMGNTLSGGQRQRIALARAILRDPAILILDEATSSLDVESEALIHQALRSFARGRTTFIVTHRLSTLDIADRIVVVRDGQIEAVGTHDQLLSISETYRRLYEVHAKSA